MSPSAALAHVPSFGFILATRKSQLISQQLARPVHSARPFVPADPSCPLQDLKVPPRCSAVGDPVVANRRGIRTRQLLVSSYSSCG